MMRFFNPRSNRNPILTGWWALAIAFIGQTGLAVGKTHAPIPDATTNQITALVRQEMQQRHIPGMAVSIAKDGKIVSVQTFGLADIENGVPVTAQTIFGFASVSKPITAVATLQLVESGRLSLDAPMKQFKLEIPKHLEQITVRQLLSHQSGLRHYQTYAHLEPLQHFSSLTEAFQSRATDALLFEPGGRFGYSTYGYLALGCIVEKVAGTPFFEQMRSNVFMPAGMTNARADHLYEIISHRARGYFYSPNGELRNSEPFDVSDKIPGGGLCGTIVDLAGFAATLQNHRLLSQKTMEMMWTPQKLSDGTITGYGLGWHIGKARSQEVYHSGSQPRTSSYLYLRPSDRIGVAILCNLERVDFLPLARKIATSALSSEALPSKH